MRIAVFSDNFYPELSGITDSIMTMGEELVARGHSVNYYVPRYSKKNYLMLHRERHPSLSRGITVHRLPSLPFPTGTGQGRLVLPIGTSFPSLRKLNPDIIHFHLFGGTGLEAVWASRVFHKPLVGTNHTPILEFIHYSPLRSRWLANLVYGYDSWLYNRCDFVASPSQTIFDGMKNFNKNIPHQVVSNPIHTDLFSARFSKMEMKKRFAFTGFTILYVGKLSVEKNIVAAIKAVALLKDKIKNLNLILVGRGVYENNLRKLAASLDIAKLVKFFGFVPSAAELAELYNASDVFVMMSTAETQSISSMQALACKVPVVAANAWGLKEYIKPDFGFLVDAGDYEAAAEKIFYLYKNPQIREKMGEAGRKYVEKFSLASVATTWENIYGSVIKRYNKNNC